MSKRQKKDLRQLVLPFAVPPCQHRRQFVTMAYVPAGVVCFDCGKLLMQYIPQSPEQLGYISATWAWKHKHGNEWTTREEL